MKKGLLILPALFFCIYLFADEPVILQKEPKTFDDFFLEALRLKYKNEHTEAFNALQEALKIDSTSSAGLYEIAQYYLMYEQNDLALDALQKAVRYTPDNLEYQMSLADLSLEMEQYDTAIILYEELVKKNPSKAELYYYLSNLYLQKKDTDKAIGALNALEDNVGVNEMISLQKYQLYKSLRKDDEAVSEIKKLVTKFPANMEAWTLLLQVALQQENADEIISICDNALIYFPDIPEFYFYKGAAYYLKKDYVKTLAVYQQGLAIIPEDNHLMFSNFYGQIGDVSHLLGNENEAFDAYDKALEYNENNIGVLNNYAYYLSVEKMELDKAERMAARCIQLQPDNPTYIDTYAWVLFQKGIYSLAKFYIESAVAKSNTLSSEITEHYGDILYKTDNPEKAVEEWKKALQMKEEEKENTKLLKKKIKDKRYYEDKK
ncbi:hypothetical protein AGMMS50262_05310 [Bacteroidia bacterium]|nr:hypothetical protein AGMMS50262_05310 [Bacteroidia bacterium]